jgi:HK97 family phage major capsid protein
MNPSQNPTRDRVLPFALVCKALAVANFDPLQAHAFAAGQRWVPQVGLALKAMVDAMATGNTSSLGAVTPLAVEFLEQVRARTVLGRVQGWRRVPPAVSVLKVTGSPVAGFIAEGAPAPMGRFDFTRAELPLRKLVSIFVTTNELLRTAGVLADLAFSAELVRAVAAAEDRRLLDPFYGETAAGPAAITRDAAVSIASQGPSAAQIVDDLDRLFAAFDTADEALERAALVLHPRSARRLAKLQSAGGALIFPNVGARGGDVWGVPAVVSAACYQAGSPSETFAALVDPAQVMLAEDPAVEIDSARSASVQIDDAPATGAQALTSLWQNGLVGIKAVRFVNWKAASTNAAAVLTGVTW